MSLEKAVRDYLRYHDFFEGDGRLVRLALDEALERGDVVRAAAVSLVETAFDYSFSIEDEDDRRALYAPLVNLLNALGMTEDAIAAPGRVAHERLLQREQAKQDAERARRVALTQEDRDAEDLAKWNAMTDDERLRLFAEMQIYRPDEVWSVTGSKDGTWGSWRYRTAEEARASWIPQYACNGCGSVGKEPCAADCPTKARNLVEIAELEAKRGA